MYRQDSEDLFIINVIQTIVCIHRGLFQFLKDVAEVNLLADDAVEILDFHTLLLHRVAVTDSNTAVVE